MRSLYGIAILTTGALSLAAQKPLQCDVLVNIDQPLPSEIHITLQHDKHCSITMDEAHTRFIVRSTGLTQQAEEHNSSNTTQTANLTEKIIALAKSKLGNSYQPSKAGPDHFDCSGFVYYLFTHNGITIPRSSLTQSKAGKKLQRNEIVRGDILFFDTADRQHINHSGIYLGGGKFIHSSSGHAYGVTISNLDKGFYRDKFRWGIRKIKKP